MLEKGCQTTPAKTSRDESKERLVPAITDDLLSRVENEQELLTATLEKLEKEMRLLPEGRLSTKEVKGNTYVYCYRNESEDANGTAEISGTLQNRKVLPRQKCLSRKDTDLAAALQRKHFIKKCLPLLRTNQGAMELFRNTYKPHKKEKASNCGMILQLLAFIMIAQTAN